MQGMVIIMIIAISCCFLRFSSALAIHKKHIRTFPRALLVPFDAKLFFLRLLSLFISLVLSCRQRRKYKAREENQKPEYFFILLIPTYAHSNINYKLLFFPRKEN